MQPQQTFTKLLLVATIATFIAVAMAASVSYGVYGDVEIFNNGTVWKCDQIYCPKDTYRCHVSKTISPNNTSVLVRENTCYSKDNKVLEQKVQNETLNSNDHSLIEVDSFGGGSYVVQSGSGNTLSHQDAEQLQNEIQNAMNQVNEEIQQNMENLQNELQNAFSNPWFG